MTLLKILVSTSLFLFSISLVAQQKQISIFGEPTLEDYALKTYKEDPEAAAIVLYEQGNYHFENINEKYIRLVKDVYRKIKVLDAKKFEEGEIEISLLKNESVKENITSLKALTNNEGLKTYVKEADIFELNINKDYYSKRFAFPNIKDGSILEYKYTIESPFFFNLNGWIFQNNYPTVYSEFTTKIPGNFNYNRSLKGAYKLVINEAEIKKKCFHIQGYTSADCELATYAMRFVPAFKPEVFMLDESNYRAAISYELRDFLDYSGSKNRYSKTWKDVDIEFKTDKDMGRQLSYKSYFKKSLPQEVLDISDDLEKAKAIYSLIQNRLTWNGNYRIFSDIRVKEAFEAKTGNIAEINLALINALEAADLDAKIMLSSTRENGVPTMEYPILTDFNYVMAYLTIGNNNYILDATNKLTPFEIIPFKTLNLKGRVMDFKEGSYWVDIVPHTKNVQYTNTQLTLNEDGELKGPLSEMYMGYIALSEREKLAKSNTEGFFKDKEDTHVEIENFSISNQKDLTESLKIKYDVTVTPEVVGNNLYVFPFLNKNVYLDENPFKGNTRKYPIDIGFPFANTYLVSIDLNDSYEVVELPKSRVYKIPQNGGECTIAYTTDNTKISVRLSTKLNLYRYSPESYSILKDFLTNVMTVQNKEAIVLKKK